MRTTWKLNNYKTQKIIRWQKFLKSSSPTTHVVLVVYIFYLYCNKTLEDVLELNITMANSKTLELNYNQCLFH